MPEELNTKRDPRISALLASRIQAGDFPSAVYLIGEHGRAVFTDALGDAVRRPETHLASLETIYDLASLTKPLITGTLCAKLVEAGELKLDSSIGNYLQEFDRPDKNHITVRELLTHTSGLPAWRPLYLLGGSQKESAVAAIANEPLEHEVGKRVVYSDLGFILLGFLLERLTGHSLTQLTQEQIIAPLDLSKTFFNPAQAARTGVAACESGNAYERDMCERSFSVESISSCHWREDVVWGEVHDGNAHFLGGAAGHAGLFSNVGGTLRLANQFVAGQSQFFNATTCEMFQQNMTEGLNEARSFGWQLAGTKDATAGPALPSNAFGHTGFTGTSCWIDPTHERVFILLTNRTHDRSLPFTNINSIRREFHQLAVAALDV